MENEDLDPNEQADPLYGHLKTLMPDASDDDLQTHVNELRSRAPGVPDDQLIQAATGAQQDAAQKQQVNSYIANKFGLGDQYSPEARQKLVDQNAADSSGPNWLAGLGALGAGIAGRDAIGAGQAILKQQGDARNAKLNEFDKGRNLAVQDQEYKQSQDKLARESDPNSQESKLAQSLAVDLGVDPDQASKLTAAQFQSFSPTLKTKYEIKAKAELAQADKDYKDKTLAQADKFHKEDLASSLQGKKEIKQMDIDARLADIEAKKGEARSEGIKALDKDYAKDYNEWTSAGSPLLSKNLTALEEAKNALSKDPSLVGGLTGTLPDRMTADRVLQQRQKVGSAIQSSLKATLGSAFTEKEGERVLKNAYNEAASPATNIASLDALINQLKTQKDSNDAKAQFFQKNGTLAGFEPPKTMTASNPGSGGSNTVRVKDPSGNIRLIPKDQVKNALAAGGSLADVSGMATEE